MKKLKITTEDIAENTTKNEKLYQDIRTNSMLLITTSMLLFSATLELLEYELINESDPINIFIEICYVIIAITTILKSLFTIRDLLKLQTNNDN